MLHVMLAHIVSQDGLMVSYLFHYKRRGITQHIMWAFLHAWLLFTRIALNHFVVCSMSLPLAQFGVALFLTQAIFKYWVNSYIQNHVCTNQHFQLHPYKNQHVSLRVNVLIFTSDYHCGDEVINDNVGPFPVAWLSWWCKVLEASNTLNLDFNEKNNEDFDMLWGWVYVPSNICHEIHVHTTMYFSRSQTHSLHFTNIKVFWHHSKIFLTF